MSITKLKSEIAILRQQVKDKEQELNILETFKDSERFPLGVFYVKTYNNEKVLLWAKDNISRECSGSISVYDNGRKIYKSGYLPYADTTNRYQTLEEFLNLKSVKNAKQTHIDEFINQLNKNKHYLKMKTIMDINTAIAKENLVIQYTNNRCNIFAKSSLKLLQNCDYRSLKKILMGLI